MGTLQHCYHGVHVHVCAQNVVLRFKNAYKSACCFYEITLYKYLTYFVHCFVSYRFLLQAFWDLLL